MHPVVMGAGWLLVLLVTGLGLVGSALNAIPATGLVIGPLLVLARLRHGPDALPLLWGALTGRLPICSWIAAHEVARSARRDIIGIGIVLAVCSLLQVGLLPVPVQLAAALHAFLPLLIGIGLRVTLLGPLCDALLAGHLRWTAALREALTPPAITIPAPASVPVVAARRGVA